MRTPITAQRNFITPAGDECPAHHYSASQQEVEHFGHRQSQQTDVRACYLGTSLAGSLASLGSNALASLLCIAPSRQGVAHT